jgi:hypothetical protein
MGKPESVPEHATPVRDAENPGYETQDVSIGGIITFLAGLSGFVIIFFFFCFVMGKAINYALVKQDGPADKWHPAKVTLGATPRGEKREDLTSNSVMEQRQLQQMTQVFPTPRLETDDGNQDLADLHAREDLLLENYSSSGDLPAGTIRIPIDRAMQLVLQKGLPAAPASAQQTSLMAGESKPTITAPLTDGFARTGYELETIEARQQKLEYSHAEAKH